MNNTTKSVVGAVVGIVVLVLGWGGMSYSSAQGAVAQAWLSMTGKVLEEGKLMSSIMSALPGDVTLSPDGSAKFQAGLKRFSGGKDQFDQAMGASDMMEGAEVIIADLEKNPAVANVLGDKLQMAKKVSEELKALKQTYIGKAVEQQKSLNDFPSTIWATLLGTEAYPAIK